MLGGLDGSNAKKFFGLSMTLFPLPMLGSAISDAVGMPFKLLSIKSGSVAGFSERSSLGC